MSYKHIEIDFKESGVYNLIGLTGSGKSAIRDAITWCYFGKSRVSGAGDELIHNGETFMYVVVNALINKKVYSVTRSKELKQTTKLEVEEQVCSE